MKHYIHACTRYMIFFVALFIILFFQQSVYAAVIFQINKYVSESSVDSGVTFQYTLKYTCASTTGNCSNMVLTDQLPSGVKYVSHVGTSDVESITHNSGTVTVKFIDPVADGKTGDIFITVRFPQGTTADETIASNQASVTGTDIVPDPTLSNTVTTTSQAKNQWFINKELLSPLAPLDQDVIYRVRFQDDGNFANLDLLGAELVDVLPAGVTFVSASDGGTYSAGPPPTVTWDMGDLGASGSQKRVDRFVTVRYESPTFSVGDDITNTLTGSGTPRGGSPIPLDPVSITDPNNKIGNPAPLHNISKASNKPQISNGNPLTYYISVSNAGNVPLSNFIVVDTIPSQLTVTEIRTGRYNTFDNNISLTIRYQTNITGTWTVWGTYDAAINNTNTSLSVGSLGLEQAEYITNLQWDFSAAPVPINFNNTSRSSSDRIRIIGIVNGTNGTDFDNCATVTSSALPQANDCRNVAIVDPIGAARPRKIEQSTGPYPPGNTVTYRLRTQNHSSAAGDLINPVMMDLLPKNLEYVDGSWTYNAGSSGAPSPVFTRTDDYNNTGRTLLRWSWTGASAFSFSPGSQVDVDFNAKVKDGTPYGSLSNKNYLTTNDGQMVCSSSTSETDSLDLDGDGDTADILCSHSRNITIAAVAEMDSEKLVKGALDTAWKKFPDVGKTTLGGPVDYQITVTNTGNVPMKDLAIIDILPFVGDIGVQDTTARDSIWSPLLTGPVSVPGVTVYYSTAGNPRRDEMGGTTPFPTAPPPVDDPPGWSTVPPADITTVKSLKFDFGTLILQPLDSVVFNLSLIAPNNAPTSDEIAWNSFGFTAKRVDNSTALLAEPNKVGMKVYDPVPAMLGNYVWNDSSSDGIQNEAATEGINGVTVRLYQPGIDGQPNTSDDILVGTTITIDNSAGNPGYYLFSSLAEGDYFLRFYPPPSYVITGQDQVTDNALDSDADPATGVTAVTSLAAAQTDLTWDIGLIQQNTASLGNYVWFDHNSDGIQNESILDGVNGVTVRLYQDSNPTPVATTVTADDINGNPGYYLFGGLTSGTDYFVEFVLPASAASFTAQDQGAPNDFLDSDADTTTGRTANVSLTPGQYNDTLDAGLIPQTGVLSLGNIVFSDNDNNGIYDSGAGETGINSVRVNLYIDNNDNKIPDTGEFAATTNTSTQAGEDGRYLFSKLPPGNYIVQIDPSNFISGGALNSFVSSTGNGTAPGPDDDIDNDDNGDPLAGYGVVSLPVTLADGTEPTSEDGDSNTNLTTDFGFIPAASIGNYVWNDTNMNGVQEGGETGISGVTVTLFDNTDTPIASTTTNASGFYSFSGLAPGDYSVGFTALTGYTYSPQNQGNDATDSNADTDTGRTINTTLSPGENDTSWDAGLYLQRAGISDFVWHDTNMNGVQDGGETGIPGVTVTLYDNAGTPVTTTNTNASGNYSFTDLAPGDYSVGFTA
ncbi:MAG: DUF11 domain-containing protein, partial [Desulfobacteraceae bacterium]|nr:DUF11 domain-containing protein [Desulfobacteraceae bacterium]